jgi:hypothetical protein
MLFAFFPDIAILSLDDAIGFLNEGWQNGRPTLSVALFL